jgi:ketosteroid isomerase-like protein
MPIKLAEPLTKDFDLIKSDTRFKNLTGEPTRITLRQATQGDVASRNEILANYTRNFDGDRVTISQNVAFDDVKKRSVFLVLVDCNIKDLDDTMLFKFRNGRPTSISEFEVSWAKLPPIVADEMYEKVLEMNPIWTDQGEA